MFKKSLKFLSYFGLLIGAEVRLDWKSDIRFVITKCLTAFMWIQIVYTQVLYVCHGETVRIFEVFSVYGMAVSVSNEKRSVVWIRRGI